MFSVICIVSCFIPWGAGIVMAESEFLLYKEVKIIQSNIVIWLATQKKKKYNPVMKFLILRLVCIIIHKANFVKLK